MKHKRKMVLISYCGLWRMKHITEFYTISDWNDWKVFQVCVSFVEEEVVSEFSHHHLRVDSHITVLSAIKDISFLKQGQTIVFVHMLV